MDTTQVSSSENSVITPWSRIVVALTMTPIIVLGTIGNILSLLVWMKIRRCDSSTACYLTALAFADLLALLTAGLNFWLSEVTLIDIRTFGVFACKFIIYMDFVCQFISAWLLTVVSAERAVSVWFPHKYKTVCSQTVAFAVILSTVFVMFLICLPFPLSADIVSSPKNGTVSLEMCIFTDNSVIKLVRDEVFWFYVELLVHFILPFIIIILSNASIIVKIVAIVLHRRGPPRTRTQTGTRTSHRGKMLKSVTLRIIILNLIFCVGVGPIHLFGYKETLQDENILEIAPGEEKNGSTVSPYTVFVTLMYLNNGANFFIYSLIGHGFRKDLAKLFREGCCQNIFCNQPSKLSVSGADTSTVPCQELTSV